MKRKKLQEAAEKKNYDSYNLNNNNGNVAGFINLNNATIGEGNTINYNTNEDQFSVSNKNHELSNSSILKAEKNNSKKIESYFPNDSLNCVSYNNYFKYLKSKTNCNNSINNIHSKKNSFFPSFSALNNPFSDTNSSNNFNFGFKKSDSLQDKGNNISLNNINNSLALANVPNCLKKPENQNKITNNMTNDSNPSYVGLYENDSINCNLSLNESNFFIEGNIGKPNIEWLIIYRLLFFSFNFSRNIIN